MLIAEDLLLNLCFLLILLFFFQIWHEKKSIPISRHSFNLYLLLSLLVCLALTNPVTSDVLFDLRQIPLTLVGLYSGLPSGLILLVITMAIRMLFGINFGFWTALICASVIIILSGSAHKWFIKQSSIKKIFLTVCFSALGTLSWITVHLFSNRPINVDYMFSYIVIPLLGTAIISYTIEMMKTNFKLKEDIVHTERIQAVSQMSASVSHEVRNPITAIRGFLQLIKDPAFSQEKRNEFIDISIAELDRAEGIISDYLTYAKSSIQTENKIDISEMLKNVINIIRPMANMNNIVVNVSFEKDLLLTGDQNKFHQSILNIVKNSIEAMPEGGTLSIASGSEQNNVYITIDDTGVGMTREQLKRLGEPYYTTKGKDGTGLGMMVTYSIIRSMKGKVHVASHPQEGTRFKLMFPRA